jgi:hypothetical protein
LAHTVGPREIGLRSTFRESLDSLLPLVAGQSRRTPKTHATGLGTDAAIAGTSNEQCALELSKAAQNGQHQPAVRSRGVRPGIRQRPEAGPGFRNRVEDVEQVARGSGSRSSRVTISTSPSSSRRSSFASSDRSVRAPLAFSA